MENFFKKSIKKLATGAAFVGALAGSPEKADGQNIKPYQAKNDKDYKFRQEMYDDSMHAYNESQKSKKIYEAKTYNELEKLAGIAPIPEKKINELKKIRNEFYIKIRDAEDPILKEQYQKIHDNYQKAIDAYWNLNNKKHNELEERFNQYPTYWQGGEQKEHKKEIYTINKNNLPEQTAVYGMGEYGKNPLENEAYKYTVPLYKKPKQKILLPKTEELNQKIEKLEQKITEQLTPQKKEEIKFPKGPIKYATVDKAGQKYFFMTDSVGGTVRSVTEQAYQNDYKDLPEVKYEDLKKIQEGK